VGIVVGVLWGLVAAAVFAAMRAHVLPAPSEVALPLAVALILVYLPVNVAIGVLVAVSRSSPSLVDLVGVTLACGAALGMAASWLLARVRRRAQRRTARS
jgi:NhaP-type Na+/H+ or K+/H+ antiporter